MDGRFLGKVALITGGARGQGRAHAAKLSAEGADIVIGDIVSDIDAAVYPLATEEDLRTTAESVEANDCEVLAVRMDVRSHDEVAALFDQAIARFGRVDFVIANAGIGCECVPFTDLTPRIWQEMIDVNLTGVMNTLHVAAPKMAAAESGRIIATSSVAGKGAMANMTAYSVSKWGVIGLVKSVAHELGPHQVTVNALCPGTANTQLFNNQAFYDLFRPDLAPGEATEDDVTAILREMTPMGVPWVEPEDVAAAAAFLCSDEARFITGVALDVAAGWSTRYSA